MKSVKEIGEEVKGIKKRAPNPAKLFTVIITTQILLFVAFASIRYLVWLNVIPDNRFNNADTILAVSVLFLIMAFFMLLAELGMISRLNNQTSAQKEMLQNIEELNLRLRAQRHDFLNHIQVVYGLVEMEEYTEAAAYLNRVYDHIESLNRFIKTGDPAVDALLQAKSNDSKRRGIDFQLSIMAKRDGLPLPSWELCRILGNLLDNAIYAAGQSEDGGTVRLFISETLADYVIEVANSGEEIDSANLHKVFDAKFTTKGGMGEGMGLFIVKETAKKAGGAVSVVSENGLTTFTVTLRKAH